MSKVKHTPVLVAAGQLTDRNCELPPMPLIANACRAAAADSGSGKILDNVDELVISGFTVDAPQARTPISRGFKNPPKSLAKQLEISPQGLYYCGPGGNTPQYLVNRFAGRIARGESETVLLAGGESLATMYRRFNRLYKWLFATAGWKDNPGGKPELLGSFRASNTDYETRHGLDLPSTVYPLFENALQHRYGRSIEGHRKKIGELFSSFTEVASNNPYAWFQNKRSAADLTEISSNNRMVSFPYTKLLNSMIFVNQAAAVVMTSTEKAKSLGIPEDQWIYLHGYADANDIWNVSERINFHSSPAIRHCGETALSMAGIGIRDVKHYDLYSCFPSAVQIGCDELEIDREGEIPLSLTGGLPYFGGPGNNYSLHGIVEMAHRLRANPGDYGLLNANGWFLTKHSVGIYSTNPGSNECFAQTPGEVPEIGEKQKATVTENPVGMGTIETYTVNFGKNNEPEKGLIIGRDERGERFIANTAKDREMLRELCEGNGAIGRTGTIARKGKLNIFTPD